MKEFIEMIQGLLIVMSFAYALIVMVFICDPRVELENDKTSLWGQVLSLCIPLGLSYLSMYFDMYWISMIFIFDVLLTIIMLIIANCKRIKLFHKVYMISGGIGREYEKAKKKKQADKD